MKRRLTALSVLSLFVASISSAHAQELNFDTLVLPEVCNVNVHAGHDMSGMPMSDAPPANGSLGPAQIALQESMNGMHELMNMAMSAADADVAFACGMIPHHLGAIAMARVELEYGDDEWVRQLAENVIAAQEQEIMEMIDWLNQQ